MVANGPPYGELDLDGPFQPVSGLPSGPVAPCISNDQPVQILKVDEELFLEDEFGHCVRLRRKGSATQVFGPAIRRKLTFFPLSGVCRACRTPRNDVRVGKPISRSGRQPLTYSPLLASKSMISMPWI